VRSRASQRLTSCSGYPPYGAAERFGIEGFERIENDPVMDARPGHRQV
jgi:hypothetical protein